MINRYGCERPLHDAAYFGNASNGVKHFGHSKTFYFFECKLDKNSAEPIVDEREFSESELRSWMKENRAVTSEGTSPELCVRVLMTSTLERADEKEESLLPIPLSDKLFEEVSESFGIPSSYMEILKIRAHLFVQVPKGYHLSYPQAQCYVFQSTRSLRGNFCASVSFQANLGLTYTFIHGLDTSEVQNFKARLRQLTSLAIMPTFIPAVLLEHREGSCRRALDDSQSTIEKVESETGLRTQWWPLRDKWIPKTTNCISTEVDFERITQDITSASTKLAYVHYRCNTYLLDLDLMDRINKETVVNAPLDKKRGWEQAELCISSLIGRLRAIIECTLARTAYQTARADIQRQTVYSLIAQKDSALNKKIAESSLQVAESTQRESTAMKSLAEDSRTLAVLALKENSSMRFLQIITVLFLPATFMATLFSTSLFDFHSSNGKPTVSNWVWLYFGLTFALTAATYILWHYSSRQKGFELLKQFKDQ